MVSVVVPASVAYLRNSFLSRFVTRGSILLSINVLQKVKLCVSRLKEVNVDVGDASQESATLRAPLCTDCNFTC